MAFLTKNQTPLSFTSFQFDVTWIIEKNKVKINKRHRIHKRNRKETAHLVKALHLFSPLPKWFPINLRIYPFADKRTLKYTTFFFFCQEFFSFFGKNIASRKRKTGEFKKLFAQGPAEVHQS